MTDQQLLHGVWEAVAQLMRRVGNDDGEDLVRGWTIEGGPGEFEVRRARDLFEASVLATARAWATGAPPVVAGPASEPVFDVEPMTPAADVRRAEILRWLDAEFPWADLRSGDSTVALRAALLLRNEVDAARVYGGAAEVAEVLRSHGIDAAEFV